MIAFFKPALPARRQHAPRRTFDLSGVPAALGKAFTAIGAIIIEHRKARNAEHMHGRLRHMSDDELTKLGIGRDGIPQAVKDRLYT